MSITSWPAAQVAPRRYRGLSYWIDIFNIFISGVALLLSVIALWFTAIIPGLDRWSRRFFIGYFIVFIRAQHEKREYVREPAEE